MTDQLPRNAQNHHPVPLPYPPLQQPHTHEHDGQGGDQDEGSHAGHGGHRLMMIACCIPMLVIVGVLVATGVAGTGAIVFAVICLGMMALMMFAMPGGHRH